MGRVEEVQEEPGELREIARRTRVIASALDEPEKGRLRAYANDLEALAAKLDLGTSLVRGG